MTTTSQTQTPPPVITRAAPARARRLTPEEVAERRLAEAIRRAEWEATLPDLAVPIPTAMMPLMGEVGDLQIREPTGRWEARERRANAFVFHEEIDNWLFWETDGFGLHVQPVPRLYARSTELDVAVEFKTVSDAVKFKLAWL